MNNDYRRPEGRDQKPTYSRDAPVAYSKVPNKRAGNVQACKYILSI